MEKQRYWERLPEAKRREISRNLIRNLLRPGWLDAIYQAAGFGNRAFRRDRERLLRLLGEEPGMTGAPTPPKADSPAPPALSPLPGTKRKRVRRRRKDPQL